jgi:hypothetical protein
MPSIVQLSLPNTADYDGDIVQDESPREYYVWQPPDKPFTIQLAFDVIDRMNVETMRGFGAVRRRGTEVGGLLLGRIEPTGNHTFVSIDDFEPVPCEYAFGPSYILSPEDLQQLRRSLAQFDPSAGLDLYTVGYFRSHTRDGLSLDDHDLKFFREYFPDPLHVALLVKPYATKAGTAGFFIEENGVINSAASYLEFPFRRKELGGGPPETDDTPSEAPPPEPRRSIPSRTHAFTQAVADAPAQTLQPGESPAVSNYETKPISERPNYETKPVSERPKYETKPISQRPNYETKPISGRKPISARPDYETKPMFGSFPSEPSRSGSRAGWLIFGLMLVIFGVVVGYQYSGTLVPTNTVSSATDPYSLNLTATRVDDNILVRWDRQSLAVKGGWRGLLTISEGEDSKSVQMDVPQLQNGTVLYRHVAPEIHFKLEVFLKEQRSIVETYTWRMK